MTAPDPTPDGNLSTSVMHKDKEYIFDKLEGGESVSIIGIGSVGKTNLVNQVSRDSEKAAYLTKVDLAPFLITPRVAAGELIHLSGQALDKAGPFWSGYELLLRGMMAELYKMTDHPGPLIVPLIDELDRVYNEIENHYKMLTTAAEPIILQAGVRFLEVSIDAVLKVDGRCKIAFLLDDMEGFLDRLPPDFFHQLRCVRNRFRQRLSFVTTSRRSLIKLADQLAEEKESPRTKLILEEFYELSHGHTHFINPLDKEGVLANVVRYGNRYGLNLSETEIDVLTEALLDITGGHAGLVHECFLEVFDYSELRRPRESLEEYLLEAPSVIKACETICDCLSPAELDALTTIAVGGEVTDERMVKELISMHLLTRKKLTDAVEIGFKILGYYLIHHRDQ